MTPERINVVKEQIAQAIAHGLSPQKALKTGEFVPEELMEIIMFDLTKKREDFDKKAFLSYFSIVDDPSGLFGEMKISGAEVSVWVRGNYGIIKITTTIDVMRRFCDHIRNIAKKYKILAIKEIRTILNLSLISAKEICDMIEDGRLNV